MKPALLIDPTDNLAVALRHLAPGEELEFDGKNVSPIEPIPPKQKVALEDLAEGSRARMYGVTVGIATQSIPAGGLITTANLKHEGQQDTSS